MKRNNDIFSRLENADDKLTETLSQTFTPLTEKQKKSILAKSEQKLEQRRNGSTNAVKEYDTVKLSEIQRESKPIWKIAACFVCLIIVGTAVAYTLHAVKPNVPVTQKDIEIQAPTPDIPKAESISSTQSAVVSGVSNSVEINTDTDVTGSDSEEIIDSSEKDNTDEDKNTEEDINTELTSDSDMIDIAYELGYTGAERLLSVTDDMTYSEVLELLGEPDTLLANDGFAQYRIASDEGERLLCLFYDSPDDVISKNGHQLYDEAIPIESLYYDTESLTFEGIVAEIHDGGSIRISCPQYPYFDCADFRCNDDEILQNITLGSRLIITHQEYVLSVYPPIIQVNNVTIFD